MKIYAGHHLRIMPQQRLLQKAHSQMLQLASVILNIDASHCKVMAPDTLHRRRNLQLSAECM